MNAAPLSSLDAIIFVVLGVVGIVFAAFTSIIHVPTIVTLATVVGWVAVVACALLYCIRLLFFLLRGSSERFWEGIGATNFGISTLGVTLLLAPEPAAISLFVFGVVIALAGFIAFVAAFFSMQCLGRVQTIAFHSAFIASIFLLVEIRLLMAATFCALFISLVPAFLMMRRRN